jgi:hypothetical protein
VGAQWENINNFKARFSLVLVLVSLSGGTLRVSPEEKAKLAALFYDEA